MPTIKCFMIEPTDRVYRWLRRYRSNAVAGTNECPVHAYHNAEIKIEDGPLCVSPRGGYCTDPMDWPREDLRWPPLCACGYTFRDVDEWQLFYLAVFRRPDTGEEYTIHPSIGPTAPPGAMFYSDWWSERGFIGPDGRSLSVITPGGQWDIDFPASRISNHWTREGTPPNVTVHPSIHIIDRYHGWLRGGELVDA